MRHTAFPVNFFQKSGKTIANIAMHLVSPGRTPVQPSSAQHPQKVGPGQLLGSADVVPSVGLLQAGLERFL